MLPTMSFLKKWFFFLVNLIRSLLDVLWTSKDVTRNSSSNQPQKTICVPGIRITDEIGNSYDVLKPVVDERDGEVLYAKGMGLHQAVVGRKAFFNLFCMDASALNNDLVIDITGPDETRGTFQLCVTKDTLSLKGQAPSRQGNETHMITEKSLPNHVVKEEERIDTLQHKAKKSLGHSEDEGLCDGKEPNAVISISCKILENQQISVNFIPQRTGRHCLNITWKGKHILSSPYFIRVDEDPSRSFHSPSIFGGRTRDSIPRSLTLEVPQVSQDFRAVNVVAQDRHSNPVKVKQKKLVTQLVCINGVEVATLTSSPNGPSTPLTSELPTKSSDKETDSLTGYGLSVNKDQVSESSPQVASKSQSAHDDFINQEMKFIRSFTTHDVVEQLSTKDNDIKISPIDDQHVIKLILSDSATTPTNEHLMESVYQTLASDALASFPDIETIEREFQKLADSLDDTLVEQTHIADENKDIVQVEMQQDNITIKKKEAPETEDGYNGNVYDYVDVNNNDLECESFERGEMRRRSLSVKERMKFFEQLTPKTKLTCDISSTNEQVSNGQPSTPMYQESKELQETNDTLLDPTANCFNEESYVIIDADEAFGGLRPQQTSTIEKQSRNSGVSSLSSFKRNENHFVCASIESVGSQGKESTTSKNTKRRNRRGSVMSKRKSITDSTESALASASLPPSEGDESKPGSPGPGGFIYDEFDDYSSFVGAFTPKQSNLLLNASAAFHLNTRIGKMLGVDPDKCRAYGPGVYSGRVGHENIFHVCTEGAGNGFLTVGMQGCSPLAVKKITVAQIDEHNYEVSYVVTTPGYFIIFVRYSDCFIMDSPFVCQVSDPSALV